jgi:hypothetical protein
MNKIRVGFFSATSYAGDPEPYVAWHQLDHMPEQFRVPGLSWGQRFFATPGCVAASAHRLGPLGTACHLQTYLFETYEPVMSEFVALGRALAGLGRSMPGALSHLQVSLQLVSEHVAPRVLLTPGAVPFRPNTGVYVVLEDVPNRPAASEWLVQQQRDALPTLLEIPGVFGIWTFAAVAPPGQAGAYDVPASTQQLMIMYLDGDPIEVSDALAAHLAPRWEAAPVLPLLAGAFRSLFPPPERFCRIDDPEY